MLQHYLEGRTLEEIARQRGEPSATTRSRLKQALERMRLRLDRDATSGRTGWLAAFLPWAVEPPFVPAARVANVVAEAKLAAAAVVLLGVGGVTWWWSGAGSGKAAAVAAHAVDREAAGIAEPIAPPTAGMVATATRVELRAADRSGAERDVAAESPPVETAGTARWRVVGRLDGLDPTLALAADAAIEVVPASTAQVGFPASEVVAMTARCTCTADGRFTVALPPYRQPSGEPPWWRGFTVVFRDPRYLDAQQFLATVDATGALHRAPHDFVVELATRPSAFAAGRVVDEQGAPLADVHVHWSDWEAADDDADRDCRSDEAGLFRIESAALGATQLSASVDDPWLAEEMTATQRSELPPERALLLPADAVVELRAGHETAVPDLVLHRGAAIRGRVFDRDGGPLPLAFIEGHAQLPAPTPDEPQHEHGWNRSIRSGPDGTFALTGIVAAEWSLLVKESAGERCHSVVGNAGLGEFVKVVAPADGVVLRLSTIAVEMTLCLDGQPQPGLRCNVGGTSPDRGSTSWLGMETDAAGRLRFAGAVDCEFTLSIDRPDLERYSPPFTLRAGETTHLRTIDLERRRPRPSLALRLVGEGATELTRCCISLEPADGSWPIASEKIAAPEDGRFLWRDLDPGRWRITVTPGGGRFGGGGCYEAETFELALGAPEIVEREIALRPTGRLSVVALDEQRNAVRAACEVLPPAAPQGAAPLPVRFVWQHASGTGSSPKKTSDDGPAFVAPPPPAGRYRLRFSAEGFHPTEVDADIRPFETTEVAVTFVRR